VTTKAALELLDHVFGPEPGPDAATFGRWLDASPRFRAFADTYRDKLRKKVATARDPAARRNLWAELGVAYLLARDRRLTVEYEHFGHGGQRAPDFTVRFRVHTVVHVEVTCQQAPAAPAAAGAAAGDRRLLATILEKLGQLPPGAANVLALVTLEPAYQPEDVARALQGAVSRMKPEDEQYILQRGFRSAREFRQQVQRLSGVLLRWGGAAEHSAGLWTHPGARHPLPAGLGRLLVEDLDDS
jgi:hypothetical protein